MNRRGFFGTLAAVGLLLFAKLRPRKKVPCDHHPDKWTCDPKGGMEPPVMRCLCGLELPIFHFNVYADFWIPGDMNDKSHGIGYWVAKK